MSLFQHIAFIVLWLVNLAFAFISVFGPLITKTSNSFQSSLQGILIFSLTFGVFGPPVMYFRYLYLGKEMPLIFRWFFSMGFLNKYVDQFAASPWFWVSPVAFILLSLLVTGLFYFSTK